MIKVTNLITRVGGGGGGAHAKVILLGYIEGIILTSLHPLGLPK